MASTETNNPARITSLKTSITPWFSVWNSTKAVAFYKAAFGATEVYKLESPDGALVVRLSVDGAEFWVSGESSAKDDPNSENLGGGSARMILTVSDPDSLFARALKAGATEIFPVGEEYGWRLGRLVDPFGMHWEIGKPLDEH